MANPVRKIHTGGTVTATVLVLVCGAFVGFWLASIYDVFRVGVLDNALANRLGYTGEITSSTDDPLPHGLSRGVLVVLYVVGFIGVIVAFAATTVSRRRIRDPEAVAYALGCGLTGAAAGFAWLATGWPAVNDGEAGAFGTFVGFGGVWVPVILAGIAALCLFVWWTNAASDDRAPTDAAGKPLSSEGGAAH
ncbi:hypothetical protein GCM10027445_26180 [Amycolatopsis endophytica]|uniref:ABC-type amino acid transport system permease subunit n=1 Tax=Amycolatopsis endophytica TaxID=860233 RepID=A0A853BAB4_9PSEU|nr:hypothetical protein [Amycolatopsis endophytica]NYI92288.1 ABC-type amino acid transport system permease subunit [Amycolatopsis endophytica]